MKGKKYLCILFAFLSHFTFSQPSNDDCDDAVRICPNLTLSGTTIGATNQGSDYNFCYTPENTVWYIFTTNNIGGSATVNFTNLTFDPDPSFGQELHALFFKTGGACGVTPYTPMSNCGNGSADFSINESVILEANTTYYIQISGISGAASNPSACDFDITLSGSAVETPDPSVSISISNTTICQNSTEPITVTITDCDNPVNYEWNYAGNSVFSEENNTFSTLSLTGDGPLYLDLTCGNFCSKTATSNPIDLLITPVSAEAGEPTFIEKGGQANLVGTGIGEPTWAPGSTLTSVNNLNTVATPNNSTTYFLTMENDGCFATDSVTVFVGEVITVFTAFSPNGDNVNDRWHIINSELFPNMEINIYDRSGQRVFSTVNYSSEDQWWDGTFKGKELPVSAYYYVIRLNDTENREYKGYVNIIR